MWTFVALPTLARWGITSQKVYRLETCLMRTWPRFFVEYMAAGCTHLVARYIFNITRHLHISRVGCTRAVPAVGGYRCAFYTFGTVPGRVIKLSA